MMRALPRPAAARSSILPGDHAKPSRSQLNPCRRSKPGLLHHHKLWIQFSRPQLSGTPKAPRTNAAFDPAAGTDGEESEQLPVEDDPDEAAAPGPVVSTTFVLEKRCEFGESFSVTGDHELLGAWDPDSALPMTWSEGHVWKCEIDLPAESGYEYKFVLSRKDVEPEWQPGPNRKFATPVCESSLIVSESWELVEAGVEDEGKSGATVAGNEETNEKDAEETIPETIDEAGALDSKDEAEAKDEGEARAAETNDEAETLETKDEVSGAGEAESRDQVQAPEPNEEASEAAAESEPAATAAEQTNDLDEELREGAEREPDVAAVDEVSEEAENDPVDEELSENEANEPVVAAVAQTKDPDEATPVLNEATEDVATEYSGTSSEDSGSSSDAAKQLVTSVSTPPAEPNAASADEKLSSSSKEPEQLNSSEPVTGQDEVPFLEVALTSGLLKYEDKQKTSGGD